MSREAPEKKGLSATWAVREVDHLFARLGYYTRFVGVSKWALGVIALVLLCSLIAWPLISKDRSGIRISFVDNGSKTPPQATSPVMNNPEYRGTTDKNEQYQVNGIRATQVTPTLIAVDTVKAQLLKIDGGWTTLTADRAEYHQDTKNIELTGAVTLMDDRGYTFVTERATVDAQTSTVHGNDQIRGVGPMGNLLASGFEIMDNGAHMVFTGGAQQVHLHIDRTKKK